MVVSPFAQPVEIELQDSDIFRFVDLNCILVSSASVFTVNDILVEISFMQMKKRIGPRIIP